MPQPWRSPLRASLPWNRCNPVALLDGGLAAGQARHRLARSRETSRAMKGGVPVARLVRGRDRGLAAGQHGILSPGSQETYHHRTGVTPTPLLVGDVRYRPRVTPLRPHAGDIPSSPSTGTSTPRTPPLTGLRGPSPGMTSHMPGMTSTEPSEFPTRSALSALPRSAMVRADTADPPSRRDRRHHLRRHQHPASGTYIRPRRLYRPAGRVGQTENRRTDGGHTDTCRGA